MWEGMLAGIALEGHAFSYTKVAQAANFCRPVYCKVTSIDLNLLTLELADSFSPRIDPLRIRCRQT